MEFTRRESLIAIAGLGAASLAPRALAAAEAAAPAGVAGPPVAPGAHQVVPLPFDPKRLPGLSERLLVSHHDNNYAGAVRNLNAVELELARVTKETPGFLVSGLRERELTFTNSVILHERYFANLGGDGKPAGAVKDAIAAAFGGFPRFEELLRATALALAGGSGWTILDLDFSTGGLRIFASRDHTQSVAFGAPLLARHVRARLPAGLRRRGGEVPGRVLRERRLGRGGAAPRAGAGGVAGAARGRVAPRLSRTGAAPPARGAAPRSARA